MRRSNETASDSRGASLVVTLVVSYTAPFRVSASEGRLTVSRAPTAPAPGATLEPV